MKFFLPNKHVRVFGRAALILALVLFTRAGECAGWGPGKAPLMTRWAAAVNPTNVWPEYPRPQLVRPDWENLNGLWDYAITPEAVVRPPPFAGKILVPFSPESALSGVMTRFGGNSKLWYHRTFSVPSSWRGRRLRLHFGAVDWRCQVWMNGHEIGEHRGGYDAFTFDITAALRWNGAEDMVVCVSDPTDDGDQPRGKQSLKPEGIFYTATSGIWQTVWLEPVPEVDIERLRLTPDIDAQALRLRVAVNSFSDNLQIEAVASAGGAEVARITGAANTELVLSLPHPHLWSPDDPFLYDLKVTLKDGAKVIDSVSSYFGMRKIALRADDQGITRIALNNKFIFELGALDQGFWPDGIYTAPTDNALRYDFEFLKRAGFNLVRMHVKVEQARGYYWCDKLGLLVWQDMPSGNNGTAASRQEFEIELQHMIHELYNHPAIVQWDLFNEGWGQFDTESLTKWIKALDPSRLVDDASGWTDMRVGNLVDMHNYPGPDSPAPEPHRAAGLGEFGGLGLAVPGHTWSGNSWAYVMLTNRDELSARYAQALTRVWELHRLRGLSAAVYTQLADVETECNGLQTYDRAVAKIDPTVLLIANRGGFWGTPMKIIQADALFGRTTWKYTTEQPLGDWFKAGFDASAWKEGVAGFGNKGTPGIVVNTTWNTSDIWLRRDFTLEPEDLSGIKLQIFHDEDVDVYLNGVLAVELPGYITDYSDFEISKEGAAALHSGENTIAVHCHQTIGGQGVDVGIFTPQTVKESDGTEK
ncbi:MAG TPA: glycoside hydrolase family 2 TIM barrel-domain containing protein [Verrucomicrobiae bacterium]|nr:glycoside hydrolase family 2 TIM barrel-domain containing protein [Verrucomicrobiae bacterium]